MLACGILLMHVAFVLSIARSPPPQQQRRQLLDKAQRALDSKLACCSELDKLVASTRLNSSSPQIMHGSKQHSQFVLSSLQQY